MENKSPKSPSRSKTTDVISFTAVVLASLFLGCTAVVGGVVCIAFLALSWLITALVVMVASGLFDDEHPVCQNVSYAFVAHFSGTVIGLSIGAFVAVR